MKLEELLTPEVYEQVRAAIDKANEGQTDKTKHVRFADLSEGGFGVSLLNDCKYGHDIHDGVMQLSLLRSPTWPDPEADQGEQIFTYALYPHAGILAESDTVREAYYLNQPMEAVAATGENDMLPLRFSAVSLDACDHVICETVKEAEEGTDTVLRMYECKNRRGTVKVRLGIPAKKVYLCDLMENPIREIPLCDGCFEHNILGFEIATFKIV